MFELLRRNRRWPIAMDIGATGIRMMQLHQTPKGLAVGACGKWDCPAEGQNPTTHRKMVLEGVDEMLRAGNFHGRDVVTALSCDDLAIKNIRLPRMPEDELRQAVQWEAQERFDFPIEPDQLQFVNAGEVRQGNDVVYELILMAVQQQTLDDHLALLKDMGLRPAHIDAQPMALFRPFARWLRRRADMNLVSVTVDIGSEATRVIVTRGQDVVFIKSIDIAGRRFNEAVASQLNLSYAEACELRAGVGSGESDTVNWTVNDAFRAEVEELAREIGLCMRYCLVTFRGMRPKSIILTGGQAYDPSVVDLLNKNLNLECKVGMPLSGVDVTAAGQVIDRRSNLSEWATCTGLALREVQDMTELKEGDNAERRLSA